MMFASPRWFAASIRIGFLFVATILSTSVALGQTQSNAADLNGVVRDPTGRGRQRHCQAQHRD